MKHALAIGILGLGLVANTAAAQTADEQARILGDFQRNVVDYTQRHKCLNMFPEVISAATPAPKVFTLPVAMVFRQLIARTLAAPNGAAISGPRATHHAVVLQPFPGSELFDFPSTLSAALPPLPAPLEYRWISDDLVIRDAEADVIIAVLRGALSTLTTDHARDE